MNALEKLNACIGDWQGSSRLYLGLPVDTPSTLTVTWSGDEAVQLAYTGAYQNEPQHGTILLREASLGQVTAVWTDTFHTGGEPMRLRSEQGGGPFSLLGSYAAPPGPDWGWRIVLEPGGGKTFPLRMFNITSEGLEEIAVEADYHR